MAPQDRNFVLAHFVDLQLVFVARNRNRDLCTKGCTLRCRLTCVTTASPSQPNIASRSVTVEMLPLQFASTEKVNPRLVRGCGDTRVAAEIRAMECDTRGESGKQDASARQHTAFHVRDTRCLVTSLSRERRAKISSNPAVCSIFLIGNNRPVGSTRQLPLHRISVHSEER
jgi:hypothetical protein